MSRYLSFLLAVASLLMLSFAGEMLAPTSEGTALATTIAPEGSMTLTVEVTAGATIALPLGGTVTAISVDWGDDSTPTGPLNAATLAEHVFTTAGTYTVALYGTKLEHFGACRYVAQAITAVTSFGDLGITDLSCAFNFAFNLVSVPTLLPTGVTNLTQTFEYASIFNQDISTWDTSAVTNMSSMFFGAYAFNNGSSANDSAHPLLTNGTSWNVSSLTSAETMFLASPFNQDIGNWDVSHLVTARGMFQGANKFDQDLSHWNPTSLTNANGMFAGTAFTNAGVALTTTPTTWNVGTVTDMGCMFCNSSYNRDVSTWDVSHVTSMDAMFNWNKAFNQDLSNWQTSALTSTDHMFGGASSFNKPLGPWDVSHLTNTSNMFESAWAFNQPLNSWNTSHLVNMNGMFAYATAFNQPLDSWDTSATTSMGGVFSGATAFTQDLSSWDTSHVTFTRGMFQGARLFNGDVSTWDVSHVEQMSFMFADAKAFNGDISNWKTPSLLYSDGMFAGASAFNQPLSGWDMSHVYQTDGMFADATSFDQDLGQWNTPKVQSGYGMFARIELSPANYDSLLNGWADNGMPEGWYLDAGTSQFTAASEVARASWVAAPPAGNGWSISDGGLLTTVEPTVTIWPSASPIVFGQSLQDSTLTGGAAAVAGTFAFSSTPVLSAGVVDVEVTFSPNDSAKYSPLTHTITLSVSQATQSLSWTQLPEIGTVHTYGTTFVVGGSSSADLPVAFVAVGGCTVDQAGLVTMTSGTTSCGLTLTQEGNSNVIETSSEPVLFEAVRATRVLAWSSTPQDSPVDSAIVAAEATLTLGGGTPVYSIDRESASICSIDALTGALTAFVPGQCSYRATVAQDANYGGAEVTGVVTFLIASPVITSWPSASVITYGQSLENSSLSGGVSSTAGTFTFASTPTLTAGTINVDVLFTPANPVRYTSAKKTITITVNKAPRVLTWISTPTDTTVGEPLAAVRATLTGGTGTPRYGIDTASLAVCSVDAVSGSLTTLTPGVCRYTARVDEDANYVAAQIDGVVAVAAPVIVPPVEPVVEEPVVEEPVVEEPVVEVPKVEESTVEGFSVPGLPLDLPAGPLVEEPAADERGLPAVNPLADSPAAVAAVTVSAIALVTAATSAAAAASAAVGAAAGAAAGAASGAATGAASGAAGSAGSSSGGSSSGGSSSGSNSSGSKSSASSTQKTQNSGEKGDGGGETEEGDAKERLERSESAKEQKYLAERLGTSVANGELTAAWGDQLPLWGLVAMTALDRPLRVGAERLTRISPLFTKILVDGAYLRAITGSVSALLPFFTVGLAIVGVVSAGGQLVPPSLAVLSALTVLGVFDAFAGFLGIMTLVVGLILTAGIQSPSDGRFLFGLILIGVGPALLANAFRALRKNPARGHHQWWERITDFAVAPVLGAWATLQIVQTLPGLGGVQFPIAEHGPEIALGVGIALFLRVAAEELAARTFPERLGAVSPATLTTQLTHHKMIGLATRAFLFFFVSGAFVGHSWHLYAGTLMFILPSVVALWQDKFPNSPRLFQILPSGIPSLALGMFISSSLVVILVSALGSSPELAQVGFVLIPLPSFILSMLKPFGRQARPGDTRWYLRPNMTWVYRIGGIVMFIVTLHLIGFI